MEPIINPIDIKLPMKDLIEITTHGFNIRILDQWGNEERRENGKTSKIGNIDRIIE